MLTISGFLVMFSGERLAGFYYIGICVIFFILTKKHVLKFLTIIVCSTLIIISFKSSVTDRFYKNTISQFNELGSVLSYRHTLHFKTAYDLFLDNIILGHGIKSFRYKCSEKKYVKSIEEKKIRDLTKINKNSDNSNKNNQKKYIIEYDNGCNTHPHNIYLEHLAELGLLGFLFLIIIFFYTSIKLIKLSLKCLFTGEKNNIYIARGLILTGIFLQLFPFVPSGSYFNNWMMIIFHLSIGFYISTLKLR
jgi:O-antigen ligase